CEALLNSWSKRPAPFISSASPAPISADSAPAVVLPRAVPLTLVTTLRSVPVLARMALRRGADRRRAPAGHDHATHLQNRQARHDQPEKLSHKSMDTRRRGDGLGSGPIASAVALAGVQAGS